MQRHATFAILCALAATVPGASARAADNAVAILDIQGNGVDEELLPTLTGVLTVEIDSLGRFKVVSGQEIRTMLGFEEQREILGCTEASCLAEIGGALGVDRIVASNIGRVGATYVVNIKLINIRSANTEGRVYETVKGDADELIEVIKTSVEKLFANVQIEGKAVAVATADDAEEEGSLKRRFGKWPVILWAVGGAAIGGGVLAGMSAANLERRANDPTVVGNQKDAEDAPNMAIAANLLYAAGVLSLGAGVVVLIMSDPEPRATLVPVVTDGGAGFALTARW